MSVVCVTVDTTLDSHMDVYKRKKRKEKGIISLIEKLSMCEIMEENMELEEEVFDNFYLL